MLEVRPKEEKGQKQIEAHHSQDFMCASKSEYSQKEEEKLLLTHIKDTNTGMYFWFWQSMVTGLVFNL